MRALLPATFLSLLLATPTPSARAALPVEADGRVQGQLVLTVDAADAGAFGLAAGEASTFVGPLELVVDPPPPPDEPLPDGDYPAVLTHFELRIGDTSWDETMPHSDPLVRIEGGALSAVSVDFTKTMPSHPDLCLFLPDPEAGVERRWLALDEVDGVDEGSLEGPYRLAAATEIPALGLPVLAVAVLAVVAFARAIAGGARARSG